MIIGRIKDGIVIDHIPAGRAMDLYRDLKLDALGCEVVIIQNAGSEKRNKKDVLKIDAIIDIPYEILGFIDANITVNFIRGGELIRKMKPGLPEELRDIIFCKNPRCITTTEQELTHVFRLTDQAGGVYRCLYCEAMAEKR